MTPSDIVKLFRMLVTIRWVRFTTAAVLVLCALFGAWSAVNATHFRMLRGTISGITANSASTGGGASAADSLMLTGDTTRYALDPEKFTPTLTTDMPPTGQSVTLWVVDEPLNPPYVVALQLGGDGSAPAARYATDQYTHPEHASVGSALFGGICFLLALGLVAAGLWLPAPTSDAKRAKRQPPKGGYGTLVVGPRRSPPSANTGR